MNYESTLQRALQNVNGDRVALAMPYDLPQRVCHDLIERELVQALVADSVECAQLDASCAGWWIDRERDQIHLRQGVGPTVLIAGVEDSRRVGPRLLLEARLKGVRRVVTTNRDGNLLEDLQVDAALIERLDTGVAASRLTGPTFEDAFEEMYELVGDQLRVPPGSFATNKVAMYVGSLGPGGAERQCTYTAAGIGKSSDWHPLIVCDHLDPPLDFFRPYVESKGIQVVQVDNTPAELTQPKIVEIRDLFATKYSALNFASIFVQIIRYASLLRTLRPSLIHCWMDYCNTLAGTAAALVGVPAIVLSCRSLAPDHFHIFQPYMRPGYRALLKRRQAMILNNSYAGAVDYARWLSLPADGVQVIHNGFDFPEPAVPQSRLDARARYAIPEGALVVGSVLRFSEEKRPQLLIDTARQLYADDPSLRFLFFGGGVMLEQMRSYVASLNLQSVVQLPGYTEETWNALAAMDVFVLTSRMEGLPNVLVEAQASGLPVVCAKVGGACEAFDDGVTGLAVEDASASSLAAAVRRILKNGDLRTKMSAQALAYARKQFGLQAMIEATHSAYTCAAFRGSHAPSARAG